MVLFVEINAGSLKGVIGTGNCMKRIRKKVPALFVDFLLMLIWGIVPKIVPNILQSFIRTITG